MTKDKSYLLSINNAFEFDLNHSDVEFLNYAKNPEGLFHILLYQKGYKAKVIQSNFENKTIKLSINGKVYKVSIADQFDQLVERMGLSTYAVQRMKDVKAPMPGLVLDIAVSIGQEVNRGDKLLILEAMKMENVIKSEGEGTVKRVHVEKGAAVDKGQLMIEMESEN